MLVNVKLDAIWQKVNLSHFKVADFTGLFNIEWHNQNKVGNSSILLLWRDHEKLCFRRRIILFSGSCFTSFDLNDSAK